MGNFNPAKPDLFLDPQTAKLKNHNRCRLKPGDLAACLLGETRALQTFLAEVNWWPVSLGVGLIRAVSHLLLLNNPSICYLWARDQVRGFEVTLPEAMAAVEAWGWFNLILYPLQFTLVLTMIAWLVYQATRRLKGTGNYQTYFGIVTISAMILSWGMLTGYLIVNGQDLRGISDLRDLTPGVGLGLLPLLAVERIGPFFREVVRGFDLFGIWTVLLLTKIFGCLEGFSKSKSFCLAVIYYSLFIAGRWVLEGPGNQLWHYFWNYGNV